MINRVKRLLDWTEKISLALMALLFTVMVASIFLQVILRYLFSSANAWSEELARYTFVWLVLLGSAVAARRNKHMNIEFFIDKFPPYLKKIIQLLLYSLIIAFLFVLIRYGFNLAAMTQKQKSTGLRIPMSWAYLAIPVGSILMLVYALEDIFCKLFPKKEIANN
ncbi:MAG: TRAP transporter small permease [Firmicutes bacterium]|nr:TRAP transporter small permease [Bacillota bacterium]